MSGIGIGKKINENFLLYKSYKIYRKLQGKNWNKLKEN